MTDFWHLIWESDPEVIAQLLRERPNIVHERDKNDFTPLMIAVGSMEREVECVDLLIRAGSDVNAKSSDGYTPLHCAVDVDGPTCRGKMPLQIIQLLVNAGAKLEVYQHWGWTPLMSAVMEGTPDEVHALLAVGADPNHVSPDYSMPLFIRGCTTLMAAIARPEKLKLLLAAGAKIDAKDDHGKTVIEYARDLLVETGSSNYKGSVQESIDILEKAKN